MDWSALIENLIKLVASIAAYLGNKQLLDAGKAEAVSAGLTATLIMMQKAHAAQIEVRTNPDGAYAASVRDKYERPE